MTCFFSISFLSQHLFGKDILSLKNMLFLNVMSCTMMSFFSATVFTQGHLISQLHLSCNKILFLYNIFFTLKYFIYAMTSYSSTTSFISMPWFLRNNIYFSTISFRQKTSFFTMTSFEQRYLISQWHSISQSLFTRTSFVQPTCIPLVPIY